MSERLSAEPYLPPPPSAAVEVGVARRDITPPVGIYARNWGAAKHDIAEGIHRPMTASVLALREAPAALPLVLVSLDAGWWQRAEDEWHVRGPLIEELGLDPARVMVACTHTHSGPSLCREDADKPGGELIAGHLDKVRDQVLAAAHEALQRLIPVTITWVNGRCDLAANRNLADPQQARIICGYNPADTADDTLLVGRVTDNVGTVQATLVNYACHLTTLAWDNRLISPDLAGAMRELVEEHTGGAPCLFLQGASGELAPREQYTGDVAIADANGRRLGFAVLAALASMLPPTTTLTYAGIVESGAPLATWQRHLFAPPTTVLAEQVGVELPLKPLPCASDIRQQLAACTDRTIAERLRRKLRVVHSVGSGPTCSMPAWIWRVGQSFFVGQPNEASSDFQLALRGAFPDYAVMVMNVVNGCCGYLSPPTLYDQNVYQVWQSPFDRQALPVLVAACQQGMRRLM